MRSTNPESKMLFCYWTLDLCFLTYHMHYVKGSIYVVDSHYMYYIIRLRLSQIPNRHNRMSKLLNVNMFYDSSTVESIPDVPNLFFFIWNIFFSFEGEQILNALVLENIQEVKKTDNGAVKLFQNGRNPMFILHFLLWENVALMICCTASFHTFHPMNHSICDDLSRLLWWAHLCAWEIWTLFQQIQMKV